MLPQFKNVQAFSIGHQRWCGGEPRAQAEGLDADDVSRIRAPNNRPCSIVAKHMLLDAVLTKGKSLPTNDLARATAGPVRQQKKAEERAKDIPQAREAMNKHAKKGRAQFGSKGLKDTMTKYTVAKEDRLTQFVPDVISEHRARALTYSAPAARAYLLACDQTILRDFQSEITEYSAAVLKKNPPQSVCHRPGGLRILDRFVRTLLCE
jgi:hypothetical protein